MSPPPPPLLTNALSSRTPVLGLRLWVVVGLAVGAAFLLLLALIAVYFAAAARRRRPTKSTKPSAAPVAPMSPSAIPPVSKEIQEVAIHVGSLRHYLEMGAAYLKDKEDGDSLCGSVATHGSQRVHIEAGKGHRMVACAEGGGEVAGSVKSDAASVAGPEVSHLGWGHWYTLRELDEATAGFAPDRVVGEGGYGIVYRGVFADGHEVAVKNLLNDNRGQAEREFTVEVEAIGRVRHKNLVRLLGYCAEGAHRILVYEYVDNGNLEQWLHGDVGPVSPLSWDARMKVVLGTAKGITYLHEGLEPKVVHRDIKSSNILLDKRWNSKVSDFGLAKLLGSDSNYVTTRVMGTFGYVAPEYASTGMLTERSDVYSFGVLVMEIISGRSPVDYARPPGEVNLVEWLKKMVSNRDYEAVLDPKLPEKPSSKALKKALLVALRCVDPDSQKRPKMGHAIHMLEVDDFPYRDDRRTLRPCQGSPLEKSRVPGKPATESGYSSCYDGNTSTAATTPSRLQQN